jgi:hypothetical protein
MADIMLVLLIIFMVITPMLRPGSTSKGTDRRKSEGLRACRRPGHVRLDYSPGILTDSITSAGDQRHFVCPVTPFNQASVSTSWGYRRTEIPPALRSAAMQRFPRSKRPSATAGCVGSSGVRRTRCSARRCRNSATKHLQTTLIEAAKMAPRYSPQLAQHRTLRSGRATRNQKELANLEHLFGIDV